MTSSSGPVRFGLAIALAVAALATGCGGDDKSSDTGKGETPNGDAGSAAGGEDAQRIAAVVKLGATTKDVKAKCEDAVTDKFVKTVYGDLAGCRKAEAPKPNDDPPKDVTVSNTRVDGDTGTVDVKFVGGDSDGASGTITVAKVGDDWKVDDLGVDLLRSQLTIGIEGSLAKDVPQFKDKKVRACFTDALDKLSDAEFKTFAYAAIADRPQAQQQLAQALTSCLAQVPGEGGGGISFLRQKFEEGIEKSIKRDGGSQQTVDCIKRQLRRLISDKEIQGLTSGKATKSLTQKTAVAISTCKGK